MKPYQDVYLILFMSKLFWEIWDASSVVLWIWRKDSVCNRVLGWSSKDEGTPLFARPNGNEAWVPSSGVQMGLRWRYAWIWMGWIGLGSNAMASWILMLCPALLAMPCINMCFYMYIDIKDDLPTQPSRKSCSWFSQHNLVRSWFQVFKGAYLK